MAICICVFFAIASGSLSSGLDSGSSLGVKLARGSPVGLSRGSLRCTAVHGSGPGTNVLRNCSDRNWALRIATLLALARHFDDPLAAH
eukprot:1515477-Alexandrium_andersonii.AAC.1